MIQRVAAAASAGPTPQPHPELLAQLRQLAESWLVREVTPEAFAFRHTLTREAVYATLLHQERRGLHLAVADTLADLFGPSPGDYLADLAFHYAQAGEWERALDFSTRAGEQAQRLNAGREACAHFTQALEAAHRLNRAPPAGLHRARGQVLELLGDFEPARADLEAALAMARQAGDRRAEWQALLDLGFLWSSNDYTISGGWLQEALALARSLDDPAVLAATLNRLGNWHFNQDEPDAALECHQEALGLFEALGDRAGLAETFDLLGLTNAVLGFLRAAGSYFDRALPLFEALNDRRGLASSLAIYAVRGPILAMSCHSAAGTLAESRQMVERSLQLARDIGWRSGEAYAQAVLAVCWAAEGEFGQALAMAAASHALAEEIGHNQWLTFAKAALGRLYTELFDLDAARPLLDESVRLAREINSRLWLRFSSAFRADALLAEGELDQTQQALDGAQAPGTPMRGSPQRAVWYQRGRLALAREQAREALSIAERLAASVPELRPGQAVPVLWELRGACRAALGQAAEAESDWQAALKMARIQNLRPIVWRLEARLGHLVRGQGRASEAEAHLSAARALVAALAETVPGAALRQRFLSGAEAIIYQDPRGLKDP